MKEQLKKFTDPIKNFLGSLTKKAKIVIAAVSVAVIVLALVLALTLNKTEYVTIYDELPEDEVKEILVALDGKGVNVKVVDGDSIQVPAAQESQVRMTLATQGYPKNGLSYYLIEENSGMLKTDYERKQYQTLQLQERLGASIETLKGVKRAIVTLAISEENVFYLTEKTEPTASVIVTMKDGEKLEEEQIAGIRKLVASAVTDLKVENVSMTDGYGNDLTLENGKGKNTKRSELANEVEHAVKTKVEHVLEAPYGNEHFRVSVTATIDTDEFTREELTYIPSDPLGNGNNTGVVDEETHATENYSSTATDGGVPGTSTNADVTTYPTNDGGSETTSGSTSDKIKYDVSYVKTLLERNGAQLGELSIGVVIDKQSFDPGERENLTELVAFAAGVPQERVSVQSFRFYEEEVPTTEIEIGFIKENLLFIIIGAAILLIILGIIAFVIHRNKKRKLEEALAEAEAREAERLLNEQFGHAEKEEDIQVEKLERFEDELVAEIKEFTVSNPEVAAQMIKTWLRADEER